MKKALCLCVMILVLACGARASVEEALEAVRAENGLLPDVPGGQEYSAEALLREMRLRLLKNDRERFDALFVLMKKHFQSPLLLLYPRLDAALRPVKYENDVGIDLQAYRLLLDASERWNEPAYHVHARGLARRILRFNVYHDSLVNGVSWKERRSGIFTLYEPAHQISLASIDVSALQRLQESSPKWEAVAQRCLGILLAGSDTRSHRLVYDVEKRAYAPSSKGVTDELRVMANLLDGGLSPLRSIEELADRVDAEPSCLAKGEDGSLTASILGGYVLARAGYAEAAHKVFLALDETYGLGENLLHAPDELPGTADNLLYLIVRELLKMSAR